MSKVRVNTKPSKRGRPFRVPIEAVELPKPQLQFDDFYSALVAADEILSRAGIKYVCSGNTLEVVMEETPQFTTPLTLATLDSEVTQYAKSALRQLTNPRFDYGNNSLKKIILPMGIIEVELMVLAGNYRPIKNFDLRYFNYDVWRIPNPINEFNRILAEIYG